MGIDKNAQINAMISYSLLLVGFFIGVIFIMVVNFYRHSLWVDGYIYNAI